MAARLTTPSRRSASLYAILLGESFAKAVRDAKDLSAFDAAVAAFRLAIAGKRDHGRQWAEDWIAEWRVRGVGRAAV